MNEIDQLLAHADELLDASEAEMQRSAEDVVTHLVCMNSRQSIVNYFISFIKKNQVAIREPATMESLLNQCRELDARFEMIDLSSIQCRCDGSHSEYCLNYDQVEKCHRVARQTKELVRGDADK